MKKLFKRKPSKKLVEAKMDEARKSGAFLAMIALIVSVLFFSQTANAQTNLTFEEFQSEVNVGSQKIVGVNFGTVKFNALTVTDDRVFYMEMQFTDPNMAGVEIKQILGEKEQAMMRAQLLRKFASNPAVKSELERLNISVRIVVKLYYGTILFDETIRAEDIPSVKYY